MKHFKHSEFDSPDLPGSGKKMDPSFLELLDSAREKAGIPFIITSGYRTRTHNIQVGGIADSSHRTGHAADISAISSRSKFIVVMSLLAAGFDRIGIGSNFVHVDNDPLKVSDLMWTY